MTLIGRHEKHEKVSVTQLNKYSTRTKTHLIELPQLKLGPPTCLKDFPSLILKETLTETSSYQGKPIPKDL